MRKVLASILIVWMALCSIQVQSVFAQDEEQTNQVGSPPVYTEFEQLEGKVFGLLTGAQLLFDLVSEIYERKVLILNTNKEFSEWQEILIDPKMTKAMIGRVTHHCHLILFPGEDWRFKHSSLSQMFKNMENENDH